MKTIAIKIVVPILLLTTALPSSLACHPQTHAQPGAPGARRPSVERTADGVVRGEYEPPNLAELITQPASEMQGALERYVTDRSSLQRVHDIGASNLRYRTMRQFHSRWLTALAAIDFDGLSRDGQIDYLLFRNRLEYELRRLELDREKLAGVSDFVPFADIIVGLQESRRRMEPGDGAASASKLSELSRQVKSAREAVEARIEDEADTIKATVANRAAGVIDDLRGTLRNWYRYYDEYDPVLTWWAAEPYAQADEAMQQYAAFLRQRVVGIEEDDDGETIIGDPIGREALMAELAYEMIPYSPEELVEIAYDEFAWCEREMLKASRNLGFGEQWRGAMEHVKTLHVQPGEQPALIRDLALEAVEFLDDHDLLTVPQLARDTWRMEMMSPRRQLVTPYFTGGEIISVSFPTSSMTHEQKMMSMRGNNIHFSRATVQHELIPGHHLQGFMNDRYRPYRSLFRTPFWLEGWALYWEMLLWDLDFPQSPENRVGMLFWRMHRCARIIFSLSFHLETMTPQECIGFLVDRVGHERNNATAEVRRSVQGGYGPLYQCAYMVGGLQFRALHGEIVGAGEMTNREFHDAILHENSIPVELVRAKLTNQPLHRDFRTTWKFAGTRSGDN